MQLQQVQKSKFKLFRCFFFVFGAMNRQKVKLTVSVATSTFRRHGNCIYKQCFGKMPLFLNKFSTYKRSSRRKLIKADTRNDECDGDDNSITLKLGDIETTFYNGQWIPRTSPFNEATKENAALRQLINQLEEENNLLKLKYEILLDMLAQSASTVKS